MKKLSVFLVSILLLSMLTGCIKLAIPHPHNVVNEVVPPFVDPDSEVAVKEEQIPAKEDFGFITLSKCERLTQEWDDGRLLWETKWNNLRVSDEDAEKYPKLAEALEQFNKDKDEASIGEAESFKGYPAELLMSSATLFVNEQQVILRADKDIVSIRSEGESYTGGAHGYYYCIGHNIDPETGNEVELSQVITDSEALYKLIFDELLVIEPYEIKEEKREDLYEYFDQGLNWTIDYNKLSVYFNPYEIASFAAGILKVDIWFDEHPEIFSAEYIKVPEAYAIELCGDASCLFDIDKTDGVHDELSVRNNTMEADDSESIFISINGQNSFEDDVYGTLIASYLAFIDGKYYIYAEVGEPNGANSIHVYELKGEKVNKVQKLGLGFKKHWDYEMIDYGGCFTEIFNDPYNVDLESYFWILETRNTAYKNYSVNGKNGIPETKGDIYKVNEDNYKKLTLAEVPVVFAETGTSKAFSGTISEGTEFTLLYTDCKTYFDCKLDDGTKFRINVDSSDKGSFIGGIDVYECLTDVMPDYGFIDTDTPKAEYDNSARLDVPYVMYEEEYVNEDGTIAPASRVELMQIVSEKENDDVDKINTEINEIYKDYLYNYAYSNEMSCDFLAWPTETDRYLNAVITHVAYPTYGTNGKVASWVYDKKTGTQYTLVDALSDAGVTEESLLSEFKDSVSHWGGKALSIDSLAFRMLPDGKAEFLAGVQLEYAPGDTWVYFMTRTDEGITNWDSVPFNPEDVTGEYYTTLYCQELANSSQFDGGENDATLSFEAASEVLSEIYSVKEILDNGRILIEDDKTVEYINDIPHIRIALGIDNGYYFEKEKVFAVAPNSVYEYDSFLNDWVAVGFG